MKKSILGRLRQVQMEPGEIFSRWLGPGAQVYKQRRVDWTEIPARGRRVMRAASETPSTDKVLWL